MFNSEAKKGPVSRLNGVLNTPGT